ncbi:GspE/PulE family protein [Patescibacteria group bacterium]|nr:GspE/PulE family protein [Patescibacteria group bacterium]
MPKFQEEQQKKKLEQIREREEEDVTKILSEKYKIPYLDLSEMTIDLDYLKIIPEQQAREAKMAVFQGVGKKIQVATQNPKLELAQNILKNLEEKYQIQTFLVSLSNLEKAWKKYKEVPEFVELRKGIIDVSPERIEEFSSQTTSLEKLKEIFNQSVTSKKNRSISELIEIMLGGALAMDASDIHIEPQENKVKVRFRFDGVLHDILEFNPQPYQLLISRIKLVSEMKLNIKDQAQDGRFSIKVKGLEIEVRSSIIPSPYGESIVMRILNPKSINVPLEALGIHPDLLEIIKKEIKKPNGMILTTGPTGSGKTTSLYTFLKEVNSPSVKIITIENPIEYHLTGITQTQTRGKNYTFASGLRSILRQDPDIIMVGEIRDLETAETALNAALTGHLVLSTLHTNDAAGIIPRLIELGANPATIAPAINLALAQRLVRKLCQNCRKEYLPDEKEMETIEKIVNSFPQGKKKPNIKNIKLFKAVGCDQCRKTGYKGRTGIFEGIIVDDETEKLILKKPSRTELIDRAKKQGFLNMQQDAILKIINGDTSLEEVNRVIEL